MNLSSFLHILSLLLFFSSTISVSFATTDILGEGERPCNGRRSPAPLESESLISSYLLDLPNELLVHILTFASPKDLLAWSEVDKRFHKLANEEFSKRVFALCPKYGTEVGIIEVKSHQHLTFLLDYFRKPLPFAILISLYKEEKLMQLIDAAFLAPKASYLKGLLFEIGAQKAGAFYYYLASDAAGQKLARRKVTEALYYGDLCLGGLSSEARFNELELRAKNGDIDGQIFVNEAIYMGYLGQDKYSLQERFEKLISRTKNGDSNAQRWVNEAIYNGQLGQDLRSEQERFDELDARAREGDENAQALVSDAIYQGNLGQDRLSPQERFAELKVRVKRGNKNAQMLINEAIYHGQLGQDIWSPQARFKKLKAYAKQGDTDAKKWVNKAICEGQLGQERFSLQERFNNLNARAAMGDMDARLLVNQAIYTGQLGQHSRPEQERFEELEARAKNGDMNALCLVTVALSKGELGQHKYPSEQRLDNLRDQALKGNMGAQKIIIDLFSNCISCLERECFLKLVNRNYYSFLNTLFLYPLEE